LTLVHKEKKGNGRKKGMGPLSHIQRKGSKKKKSVILSEKRRVYGKEKERTLGEKF